jgi:hypothetical protein
MLVIGVLDRRPGVAATPWQRLTRARVSTWVGTRSYSIYLWHWPVILLVSRDNPSAPGTASHLLTRLWCVVVIVALADLTCRWVETPFRRHGFGGMARLGLRRLTHWSPRSRQVLAAGTAALTVVTAVIVLTAPDQSETARILEANEAAAAGVVATTPSPSGRSTGSTASIDQPGATKVVAGRDAKASFTMPKGREIDAYGDSMMVGSVHALDYYFPGIRMNAKSNRRWSDGLAAIKARGDANRRAIILSFGTNAGVDEDQLVRVLDTLGPDRMVVLVNLMGPFARIDTDNATLELVAKGRANVVVADWARAVRDHPEQLQADRIHPSLKGSHLFAKTVRQAFATLAERHTGKKVVLEDLPTP